MNKSYESPLSSNKKSEVSNVNYIRPVPNKNITRPFSAPKARVKKQDTIIYSKVVQRAFKYSRKRKLSMAYSPKPLKKVIDKLSKRAMLNPTKRRCLSPKVNHTRNISRLADTKSK